MNPPPEFHQPAPEIRESVTEKFKIGVARMEALSVNDPGSSAQVTFRIDSDRGNFYIPVLVNRDEFDEADLTMVARSLLHETFAELSQRTIGWKLAEEELRKLSRSKRNAGA